MPALVDRLVRHAFASLVISALLSLPLFPQAQAQFDTPSDIPGTPVIAAKEENGTTNSIFYYPNDFQGEDFYVSDTINATFQVPIPSPIVTIRCGSPNVVGQTLEQYSFEASTTTRWLLVGPLKASSAVVCLLYLSTRGPAFNITPYHYRSRVRGIKPLPKGGVGRLLGPPDPNLPSAAVPEGVSATSSITTGPSPSSSTSGADGETPTTIGPTSATAPGRIPETPTSGLSVGAVGGISAAAGAVAIGAVVLGFLFWRKRRRNDNGDHQDEKLGSSSELPAEASRRGHELDSTGRPLEMPDPREHVSFRQWRFQARCLTRDIKSGMNCHRENCSLVHRFISRLLHQSESFNSTTSGPRSPCRQVNAWQTDPDHCGSR